MTKTLLTRLNPEQENAVRATDGRVLILAGAGSGKTSVIINRILYLIENHYAKPSEILGLTFTNKAAEEMRKRISAKVGAKTAEALTLTTFHSFCFHVLKREIHHLGYLPNFTLYDDKDIRRLIHSLAKQGSDQETSFPTSFQSLSELRTQASQEGITKEEQKKVAYYKELASELETCLKTYNAVDFDGLLELTVKLFEDHPDVLNQYQTQFQFIMIDEYQDTNQIQYRLAELLAKKHNNFFVVGDDDQSIYGWRGSEVKHILNFKHQTLVKLEQNYRSSPNILNAANAVIKNNKVRHPKVLWSDQPDQEPVHIFHAPTEEEEVHAVIQRILYLHVEKEIPLSEIAILYRSNQLARQFETALLQASYRANGQWVRGIPYQIVQGTEFFERAEVKDLFAYLKVLSNPKDTEALLRIINYPRRGISPKTVEALRALSKGKHLSLWNALELVAREEETLDVPQKARLAIKNFVSTMQQTKQKMVTSSIEAGFSFLIEEIAYQKQLEDDTKSDKARIARVSNIGYTLEMIASYEKTTAKPTLQDFLCGALLDHQKAQHAQKNSKIDKLQLLTFHSAKGLEFTACFLIALEDNIIPHEKSMQETGLEEERRLMYVAMTRAKKYLTLSMARSRKRNGGKPSPTNPSRFLYEIPSSLLKVAAHQGAISYTA